MRSLIYPATHGVLPSVILLATTATPVGSGIPSIAARPAIMSITLTMMIIDVMLNNMKSAKVPVDYGNVRGRIFPFHMRLELNRPV